jgi:hypothetical protein
MLVVYGKCVELDKTGIVASKRLASGELKDEWQRRPSGPSLASTRGSQWIAAESSKTRTTVILNLTGMLLGLTGACVIYLKPPLVPLSKVWPDSATVHRPIIMARCNLKKAM